MATTNDVSLFAKNLADNGIGVASIMTILQSKDIPHPALEALFTIDEETGMTGAKGLKGGLLSGDFLLNLDTEEDDEIDIGCAGGVDVSAFREYDVVDTPDNSVGYTLTIKGLHGGHSGTDIHKGYANANKLMVRFLREAIEDCEVRLASWHCRVCRRRRFAKRPARESNRSCLLWHGRQKRAKRCPRG